MNLSSLPPSSQDNQEKIFFNFTQNANYSSQQFQTSSQTKIDRNSENGSNEVHRRQQILAPSQNFDISKYIFDPTALRQNARKFQREFKTREEIEEEERIDEMRRRARREEKERGNGQFAIRDQQETHGDSDDGDDDGDDDDDDEEEQRDTNENGQFEAEEDGDDDYDNRHKAEKKTDEANRDQHSPASCSTSNQHRKRLENCLSEFLEKLRCPICSMTLLDPLSTSSCAHVYCKPCIVRRLTCRRSPRVAAREFLEKLRLRQIVLARKAVATTSSQHSNIINNSNGSRDDDDEAAADNLVDESGDKDDVLLSISEIELVSAVWSEFRHESPLAMTTTATAASAPPPMTRQRQIAFRREKKFIQTQLDAFLLHPLIAKQWVPSVTTTRSSCKNIINNGQAKQQGNGDDDNEAEEHNENDTPHFLVPPSEVLDFKFGDKFAHASSPVTTTVTSAASSSLVSLLQAKNSLLPGRRQRGDDEEQNDDEVDDVEHEGCSENSERGGNNTAPCLTKAVHDEAERVFKLWMNVIPKECHFTDYSLRQLASDPLEALGRDLSFDCKKNDEAEDGDAVNAKSDKFSALLLFLFFGNSCFPPVSPIADEENNAGNNMNHNASKFNERLLFDVFRHPLDTNFLLYAAATSGDAENKISPAFSLKKLVQAYSCMNSPTEQRAKRKKSMSMIKDDECPQCLAPVLTAALASAGPLQKLIEVWLEKLTYAQRQRRGNFVVDDTVDETADSEIDQEKDDDDDEEEEQHDGSDAEKTDEREGDHSVSTQILPGLRRLKTKREKIANKVRSYQQRRFHKQSSNSVDDDNDDGDEQEGQRNDLTPRLAATKNFCYRQS